MPIPEELTRFHNEEDFTKRLLVPLFLRLGFAIVANYHGRREFGKDLLIGEIDRFSHVRFHGVQAKFESSIGKEAMHGLIHDCDEAFVKPFIHPQTGQQQKISSFYAVNAGSVSDEARELFFEALQPKHADNVRIIDGKDLLALDRFAVMSRIDSTRELLDGLLHECRFCKKILKHVAPILDQIVKSDGHHIVYPLSRLRMNAVVSFLTKPLLFIDLSVEVVERFWSNGAAFNQALDQAGTSPLHTVVSIKVPAIRALQLVPQLTQDIEIMHNVVERAMEQLGPLASV